MAAPAAATAEVLVGSLASSDDIVFVNNNNLDSLCDDKKLENVLDDEVKVESRSKEIDTALLQPAETATGLYY